MSKNAAKTLNYSKPESDEISLTDEALNHIRIHHEALAPGGGYVEYRVLPKGESMFIPHDAPERFLGGVVKWLAQQSAQENNVFVGVNPRVRESGSKNDVENLTTLFLDLDLEKSNIAKPDALSEIERISPIAPDLIVDSGGGLHVYWYIAPTTEYEAWLDAQRTVFQMFEHIGADSGVTSDSARILRITPFPNWKYEKESGGRKTSIVEFTHREVKPSITEFSDAFGVITQPRKRVRKQLPDVIYEGSSIEGPGRNSTLTSLAGAMRKWSLDADEILPTLHAINQSRCAPPLPDDEVESIATSMMRYEAGELPQKTSEDTEDEKAPVPSNLLTPISKVRETDYPAIEWLFRGVSRGEVCLVAALPDSGKTSVLRNATYSAAAGKPFLQLSDGYFYEGGAPLRVSYWDFEDVAAKIKKDEEVMTKDFTPEERKLVGENVAVYSGPSAENTLNLSKPAHFAAFEKAIIDHRSDVVIIDTMTQAFSLQNENDNSEVGNKLIKPLMKLAKNTNAGIIFTTHIGKRNPEEGGSANNTYRSRGASSLEANVRTVIYLDKKDDDVSVFIFKKLKDDKPDRIALTHNRRTRWYEIDSKYNTADSSERNYWEIVGFVERETATGEIIDFGKQIKLSRSTVYAILDKAEGKGDLVKVKRGLYAPAEIHFQATVPDNLN